MSPRQKQLVAIAVGLSAVGVSAAAQSTRPQESDVLQALLVEVRSLRATVEQMASAGPRVQLALGRLQIQEQRVHTSMRRLDSNREALAAAEKEQVAAQAQLAMMQKMFEGQVVPPEGNPLGDMLRGLRKAAAARTADIQRLQADETLLEQEVANEQARWLEVNRALEDLERALAKRGNP